MIKTKNKFIAIVLLLSVILNTVSFLIPEGNVEAAAIADGTMMERPTWNTSTPYVSPGAGGPIPDGFLPLGMIDETGVTYPSKYFFVWNPSTGQVMERGFASGLYYNYTYLPKTKSGFVPIGIIRYTLSSRTYTEYYLRNPLTGETAYIHYETNGQGAPVWNYSTGVPIPAGFIPHSMTYENGTMTPTFNIINPSTGEVRIWISDSYPNPPYFADKGIVRVPLPIGSVPIGGTFAAPAYNHMYVVGMSPKLMSDNTNINITTIDPLELVGYFSNDINTSMNIKATVNGVQAQASYVANGGIGGWKLTLPPQAKGTYSNIQITATDSAGRSFNTTYTGTITVVKYTGTGQIIHYYSPNEEPLGWQGYPQISPSSFRPIPEGYYPVSTGGTIDHMGVSAINPTTGAIIQYETRSYPEWDAINYSGGVNLPLLPGYTPISVYGTQARKSVVSLNTKTGVIMSYDSTVTPLAWRETTPRVAPVPDGYIPIDVGGTQIRANATVINPTTGVILTYSTLNSLGWTTTTFGGNPKPLPAGYFPIEIGGSASFRNVLAINWLGLNPPPSITVNNANQSIYLDSSISLSGALSDAKNSSTTVTASFRGIQKQVTIPIVAGYGSYTLSWSGAELAKGTYSNLVVSTSDGASATYTGSITISRYTGSGKVQWRRSNTTAMGGFRVDDQSPQPIPDGWLPAGDYSAEFYIVNKTTGALMKRNRQISTSVFTPCDNNIMPIPVGYVPAGIYQSKSFFIYDPVVGFLQGRNFTDPVYGGWDGGVNDWNPLPVPAGYQIAGYYSSWLYIVNTQTGAMKRRPQGTRANWTTTDVNPVPIPAGYVPFQADSSTLFVVDFIPDSTPPALTVNNTNQTINVGSSISLTGMVSDADSNNVTISATMGGVVKQVIVSATPSSTAWSLTWSWAELPQGSYTNIVVTATDSPGASVTQTFTGTIVIDKTAPTTPTIIPGTTNWTNASVAVSITHGTDALSGTSSSQYSLSGSTVLGWTTYTGAFYISNQGTTTITARTIDKAGNISGTTAVTVYIDLTNPNVPVITTTTTWTSAASVAVTITGGTDPPGSGVKQTDYQLSGATTKAWAKYTVPYAVTNEGQTTNWARTSDNAGNVSGMAVAVVRIDRTAPSTPVINPDIATSSTSWSTTDVKFTVTPGTDGASGVNRTEYMLSGVTTLVWTTYTSAVTLTADGITTVSVRSIDNVGNISVVTTKDIYIDKIPPTLVTVHVRSNNSNTDYAKVGDTVTLTFTASKKLGVIPTVSIQGTTVTASNPSGDMLNFTASYVTKSTDPEDIVPYLISNIKDNLAGLTCPDVSGPTDGSYVIFLKTAPTLNPVSIMSSNASPGVARSGDTISIYLTASKSLGVTPTVKMFGNLATITSLGGTGYRADYIIKPTDPTGTVTFLISNLKDMAGNLGIDVNSTTDSSTLSSSGGSGPTISGVNIYSSNSTSSIAAIGDTVVVKFTSSALLSNTTSATIDGVDATIESTGNNNYRIYRNMSSSDPSGVVTFSVSPVRDTGGNATSNITSTTDGSKVTFSSNPNGPALSSVTVASNNPNPSLAKPGNVVTVSFTSSVPLGGSPTVSINGRSAVVTNTSGNSYKGTYTMSASDSDGVIPFMVSNVKDTAGNTSNSYVNSTDGTSVTFKSTLPTLTTVTLSSSGGSTVSPGDVVTINFTASDPLSTLPMVEVNGAQLPVSSAGGNSYYSQYTVPPSGGTVTFIISKIIDKSGNTGIPVTKTSSGSSFTSNSSGSGPLIITVNSIEEGASYSGGAIPLFSASSTASPTINMTATLNGTPFTSGTPVTSVGSKTLIIHATDGVGNTATITIHFIVT
jgi:hypothetical protein